MSHVLDRPIWNSLLTGNKTMALGTERVKYLQRDVGLFAGFKLSTASALKELAQQLGAGEKLILFMPDPILVPAEWKILSARRLLQMVYTRPTGFTADYSDIIPLQEANVPAMLQLTDMTKPGPFLKRPIDFGNYEGIFSGNQLVAMVGQRLRPRQYTEISALCTHPNLTGKGLAARLLQHQIDLITQSEAIPFLHVYPENPARNLYKKLGFTTRRTFMVYLLEKQPT